MTKTRSRGASRLAAIGAVATLALTAALALPALRGVIPATPVGIDAVAAHDAQRVDGWLIEAEVTLLPELGYRLDIRLTREAGTPAPNRIRPIVVVEMTGMNHRFEPPLVLVGTDGYLARGTLPMPGRWRFGVGFGDGLLDLVVDVPKTAGTST